MALDKSICQMTNGKMYFPSYTTFCTLLYNAHFEHHVTSIYCLQNMYFYVQDTIHEDTIFLIKKKIEAIT